MRLAFDFETDGLFADTIRPGIENPTIISRVHCLVTQDIDTGKVDAWYTVPEGADPAAFQPPPSGDLVHGVTQLLAADFRYAHNGSLYDERVIREFYRKTWEGMSGPAFADRKALDSQAAVAAIWPTEHLRRLDSARIAEARRVGKTPFPSDLIGRHSLEAWGARLGNRKADFDEGFEKFTPKMLAYCVQDVSTLRTLVQKIDAKIAQGHFSLRAWELEQDFKVEIAQQVANGFAFDREAADRLTATLQGRRAKIVDSLAHAVAPFKNFSLTDPGVIERQAARVKMWEERVDAATPRGRLAVSVKLESARRTLAEKRTPKLEVVTFNPGSRSHIARHLQERHGWKPDPRAGYTDSGEVKIDESVLEGLRQYPYVPEIIEYLTISKLLGMLAEGKTKDSAAWIKMVGPDGRIHGQVDHNGAVTSRCTHRKPNMTQVPKVGNPYGRECRSLFTAAPGNVLVGADASGLELRMLAHFLHKYDGGEYARAVVEGDVHTKNQDALEIPRGATEDEQKERRDRAKRSIYAELYGAGEEKLGRTIDPTLTPAQQKARGRRAKASLLANTKGLRALKERTADLHKRVGSVNLPDGRRAWTRADYSALNTLLQASGAIVVKLWTVLMHRRFRAEGLKVMQVHTAHDEVQFDVAPEIAPRVCEIALETIVQAGVELGIRCPLKGEATIGAAWAATH